MAPIRPIHSVQDAEFVLALAASRTVVIYKHSPICSISETALEEFEAFAQDAPEGTELFSVDVLEARPASRKIEEETGIRHESPQILVLANGGVIWHASHRRIRAADLGAQMASLSA
ncbi:MAG: bacillithiol system protein YtxJ [Fibrobacteria bacterium]|jgi:bacillithiol system protein YtxJ|nr:bacillithiol system protein YtxJ [Fibrobacteria bacterium]